MIRLSGLLADRPDASAARYAYYLAVAQPEVFTVDFGGLTGNDVAGKYITAADADGAVYFWFNTGVSVDPAPGGRGIEVALDGDVAPAAIATAMAAVADDAFTFSAALKVATVTNAVNGPLTDAADGDSGAVVATTQQGRDAAVYESDGIGWLGRTELDRASIIGRTQGLDADKPQPSTMIGWLYHATDTGFTYEAFPGAWAVSRPTVQAVSPLPARPTDSEGIVSIMTASGLCQ